jgi:hypothetical protein
MFQYPIPEHTLEECKSKVTVDSYTAIMFARATALSLKDSLEFPTGAISLEVNKETSQDTKTHILELANTLQDILGEAMDTVTTMFPHKAAPPPSRGTLPRYLWPNSLRHDVAEIRRRAKAVHRLVRIEAKTPKTTSDELSLLDTHLTLWSCVTTPLQLRTTLSPLPRGFDTLGLITRKDLQPKGVIPPPKRYNPASEVYGKRSDSY